MGVWISLLKLTIQHLHSLESYENNELNNNLGEEKDFQ